MAINSKICAALSSNIPLSKNFVQSFLFTKKGDSVNLIFGVIEYRGHLSDPQVLELISSKVNSYYFEDNIWDEEITTDLQELQFENSLQKLNSRINTFLNSYQGDLDPSALKIMVGTLLQEKDNKFRMCLTQAGNKMKAIIFHEPKTGPLKLIDVFANHDLSEKVNPLKMFPHLLSGQLTRADQILVTSETLFDTVSGEEIKKTVVNLPPASALEHLKNQVARAGFSFGGVIIKVGPIEAAGPGRVKSASSVQKLFSTERETKKILAPGLGLNLINQLNTALAASTNFLKNQTVGWAQSIRGVNLGGFKKTSSNLGGKLKNLIPENFGPKTLEISKSVLRLTKIILVKSLSKIFLLTRKTGITFWHWFKNLPVKHKISFGGGLILLLIFSQSVVWISRSQAKAKEESLFRKKLVEIEEKIDRAEAAIIFKEDEKAKTNLVEAENLIANLSAMGNSRKVEVEKLEGKIKSKFEQIQRVVTISEPRLIAQINGANLKQIALSGNKLLVSGDHPDLWLFTLKATPEVKRIDKLSESSKSWPLIEADENNIFIFDQDKKLFVYDRLKDKFEPLASPLRNNYKIKDTTIYNQRLYVLEETTPQIYRFGRATGGFAGEAVRWVKESASLLNGAVSFTVDNALYLLKPNGQITKLVNGFVSNPPMTSVKVEPAIQSASKIYTSPDSPNLYVMDPPTKRLIVLSKTGQLVIQYTSDKFDQLIDFSLDESAKKIYLLNGTKIFEIDLKT